MIQSSPHVRHSFPKGTFTACQKRDTACQVTGCPGIDFMSQLFEQLIWISIQPFFKMQLPLSIDQFETSGVLRLFTRSVRHTSNRDVRFVRELCKNFIYFLHTD